VEASGGSLESLDYWDPEVLDPPSAVAARIDWVLPRIDFVRGKAAKADTTSLACLLIYYRSERAHGVSREEFLHQTAQAAHVTNGYSRTQLATEGTVAEYLKAAERRARNDASFARLVKDNLKSLLRRDNPQK
jgi:hypothetical protein